jgi:hypothetical protein
MGMVGYGANARDLLPTYYPPELRDMVPRGGPVYIPPQNYRILYRESAELHRESGEIK